MKKTFWKLRVHACIHDQHKMYTQIQPTSPAWTKCFVTTTFLLHDPIAEARHSLNNKKSKRCAAFIARSVAVKKRKHFFPNSQSELRHVQKTSTLCNFCFWWRVLTLFTVFIPQFSYCQSGDECDGIISRGWHWKAIDPFCFTKDLHVNIAILMVYCENKFLEFCWVIQTSRAGTTTWHAFFVVLLN